jgi:hypothetical protein
VGPGDNQLLLIDTYGGNVEVLMQSDLGALEPVWKPDGNTFAFLNFLNGPAISTYDMVTRTFTDIVSTPGYSSTPQSWSPDGSQLLSISYSLSNAVGQYQLQQVTMSDGTITPLFTYTVDSPVIDIPLPAGATVFNLRGVEQARWNPVYPEWILVQLAGYDENLLDPVSGYPSLIAATFLYNLQTGEKLSLDILFSARISYFLPIQWSADGRYLVLETDEALGTTQIVRFENVNGVWTLQVADGVRNLTHAAIDWLDVSDLLLAITSEEANEDAIFHISQIINGTWFTTEFVRLPDTTFERVTDQDWYLTASEEEKHTLSCLFDQALSTRLSLGARAQVNFTDGTPLRLHTEPSVDATEILQMLEGTEFNIIGGPVCDNAASYYRFWQVQLDDGTQGWAAEADNQTYFIEPLSGIIVTPTETPTNTPTPTATPAATSPLASFTVLGQEGIWFEQDSVLVSGDVGANVASSGPFLAEGSEVTIGMGVDFLSPSSRVFGDSVYVRQGAQVYDVYYNSLSGQGQILGQQVTPLALPLVQAFPTVPSFAPGTQNFNLQQNGTLTLDAGSYGTLQANQGATITFTGGVYNFQEWNLGMDVNVSFAAPTEIRVAGRLQVGQGSYIGPATGSNLDATDIIIYVTGQNGNTGNLGGTPKAAHFGINNTLIANVYAPNGTLWIRQGSTARGAFLGRWVDIGIGVQVTLESGF